MSEVARIKHLFNLKEIADSGHQSQNSQIGKLLKEVLYPEPPKLNDLLSKLGTGQFFIERSPKAGIPEDFYNLGDFVEQMLKKILAQDKLIVGRIRDQLTPEQQRYISDLHNDGGIEPKEEPVKAKSGSGKFYVLRNITGKGVRDVSTKEASTPNPWKDSAKWKENSQTETRSMEEQKNSLKMQKP
ncbi:MAG: hypothetical protein HWD61_11840 [Parachlamydiaceae bacterium]|nr:MAG: hypothetical protein HWD61_11840 [Parachlamydiaceae bacterium]